MYYFEYDKKGFLFKYKESTNSEIELLIEKKNNSYNEDSVLSYYFLTGSTIYRVENYGIDKSVVKYDAPIMFRHRFEAGESWMSVVSKENVINFNHPKEKEKEDDNIERKHPEYYYDKKSDLELVGEIYGDNYYSVPKVKKQLFLENDKLYNFKIQIDNNNLMKWKSLIDFIN